MTDNGPVRLLASFVFALTVACGNDSSGGPPKAPGVGGTGGSTGGSSGGSSGGGSGGSSTVCVSETLGDLWERMNGSYTMLANGIGSGAETDFTRGESYQVEVSKDTCSLIFHGAMNTYTCVWGNPAELNKMEDG